MNEQSMKQFQADLEDERTNIIKLAEQQSDMSVFDLIDRTMEAIACPVEESEFIAQTEGACYASAD